MSRGGVSHEGYAAVMLDPISPIKPEAWLRATAAEHLFRLVDDVEQPGDVRGRLRRGDELEVERVLQRTLEVLDLANLHSRLREEAVHRLFGDFGGDLHV